jgi:hypothetical protein
MTWFLLTASLRGSRMTRFLLPASFLGAIQILGGCVDGPGKDPGSVEGAAQTWTLTVSMSLANVGFAGPVSVVHDAYEDVYLVVNANAGPMDGDGKGFISRVSAIGQVLDLKWVDGEAPGVTLHFPGGMAILHDTLFVADLHCLRRFHRVTGQPLRDTCLDPAVAPGRGAATRGDGSPSPGGGDGAPGAGTIYLSDVATTSQGDVFFSEVDSASGAGAIYFMRSTAEVPQVLALADGTLLEGDVLGGPRGIASDEEGLLVATFGSGELFRVTTGGERIQLLEPSNLRLHGVLSLGTEGVLVSSRGDSAIYRVAPDGSVSAVVPSLPMPGCLGYDANRGRILIPLQGTDELLVMSVAAAGSGSSSGSGPGSSSGSGSSFGSGKPP